MEDIGDYLYFILLIVFSLVGLLKKKKAAKPLHETMEEDEEYDEKDVVIFPPVDDWENTQSKPETVPTIDWPVFTKPETKTPKTVFEGITDSYETATDFTKIKARSNVKPVKTEVKKQTFNFEEFSDNEVQDYAIETPEDARRAIILSEIINRKY